MRLLSREELAGVMAHELAHVVLRHGTAQATKAQPFQIGGLPACGRLIEFVIARVNHCPHRLVSM